MPDEELRETFNRVAELYDRVRPAYPEALIDHLVTAAALRPGDRVLEVGCGTGKATLPLAARNMSITALELGPSLAAVARANLAPFRDVVVIDGAFESYIPTAPFDAVIAATSWHWIDAEVRAQLAWAALRPAGHLAIWTATHVVPHDGDSFFVELQDVYDEINEGLPPGALWPRPGEMASQRADVEGDGLFTLVDERQFDWEIVYDAEGYIDLLNTFSGHIAMADWQRVRLYGEIRRRLALRPDNRVRRHWGAVLSVARRVG